MPYPKHISQDGFFYLLDAALEFGLDVTEFKVYYYLLREMDNKRSVFKSMEKIASSCKLERKTISKALKSLTVKGLVSRKRDFQLGYSYFLHEQTTEINKFTSNLNTPSFTCRDKEKKLEKGWVYLIKIENTDTYKIGRTKNLNNRLKQLRNGLPYTLLLVDYFLSPDAPTDEEELHQVFKNYRVQGEWFDFSNCFYFKEKFRSSLYVCAEEQVIDYLKYLNIDTNYEVLENLTNFIKLVNCKNEDHWSYFWEKIDDLIEGCKLKQENERKLYVIDYLQSMKKPF